MSDIPVPRRKIRRIHSELARDVSVREQDLGRSLPIDATANVAERLRDTIDNWESGRKSIRTLPACNVYARHCERPVPESIMRTLTGLDATVNVLDDIIDTRDLTKQSKVTFTANAAFSAVLMLESCSPRSRDEINDILLEYFTALFQIPLVERKLFDQLREARSSSERRKAAENFYAYRSRDIDAFARLPATAMGVTADEEERFLRDLRAYRSRRLLFKDIRDVERDLDDDDITPVIHFLRTCETTDGVVNAIEDLHGRFTYSDLGQRRYGDILEALEDPPEDLHSVVRNTRNVVVQPPNV